MFQDARFNEDIDIQTGYKTHSILCMPIKDVAGEVIGVAQAVNKITSKDEPFDEHDEKVRQVLSMGDNVMIMVVLTSELL